RVEAITADALAVSVSPGRSPYDEIAAAIGSGSVLLVVDNCEHVLDASARLVDALLRACPNLAVLATSREPLRVREERVFNLRPLSGGHARADENDDAVRLFV